MPRIALPLHFRSRVMRMKLAVPNVKSAKPVEKRFEIHDTELKGLALVVHPIGVKSFIVQWARVNRITLGHYPVLTPEGARVQALAILADVAKNGTPTTGTKSKRAATFADFIKDHYEPWVTAERK